MKLIIIIIIHNILKNDTYVLNNIVHYKLIISKNRIHLGVSKINWIIHHPVKPNITVHKQIKITILIGLSLNQTNFFGVSAIKIMLSMINNHKWKFAVKLRII